MLSGEPNIGDSKLRNILIKYVRKIGDIKYKGRLPYRMYKKTKRVSAMSQTSEGVQIEFLWKYLVKSGSTAETYPIK